MNKQTGITLISLIITIIIMLIIATVSISMVVSEEGIIKKALLAKENTHDARDVERLQLVLTDYLVQNKLDNTVKLENVLMEEEWCKEVLVAEDSDVLYVFSNDCNDFYGIINSSEIVFLRKNRGGWSIYSNF